MFFSAPCHVVGPRLYRRLLRLHSCGSRCMCVFFREDESRTSLPLTIPIPARPRVCPLSPPRPRRNGRERRFRWQYYVPRWYRQWRWRGLVESLNASLFVVWLRFLCVLAMRIVFFVFLNVLYTIAFLSSTALLEYCVYFLVFVCFVQRNTILSNKFSFGEHDCI